MSQDKQSNPKPENDKDDLKMDLFFPEDLVKRLAPEEVTVTDLTVKPYEDGRRIHVNIEMSPFEKRPHLEVNLTDAEKQEISTASFVEPLTWKLDFTMHLRTEPADGPLDLEVKLFYPDGPEAKPVTVRFNLPQT